MKPRSLFALLVALVAASACRRVTPPAETKGGGDEVRPVYPAGETKSPQAKALCRAFHQLPEAKRAGCCGARAGVDLAGECERTLGGAVASGAIRLVPDEVDACAAAIERALEGCDWVGPWPFALPDACRDVVHGTVASGQPCRSSLECAGEERCHDVGPTRPGRCGSAHEVGAACALGVDPLAGFVRIDDLETRHPECVGRCDHHRCQPALTAGAACNSSSACGRAGHCAGGRCVAGARARTGEACSGGDCQPDARCVRGRCIVPQGAGAPCQSDFECRGGCVRGACDKRCDLR